MINTWKFIRDIFSVLVCIAILITLIILNKNLALQKIEIDDSPTETKIVVEIDCCCNECKEKSPETGNYDQ